MNDVSPSVAALLTAWARRIKEVTVLCDEFPCPYGYDDFEPGCDCFRCKVHRAAALTGDDQAAEACENCCPCRPGGTWWGHSYDVHKDCGRHGGEGYR